MDDKDFPYSDEWLEQHAAIQFKRLLKEMERREKEEAAKPYFVRLINRIKLEVFCKWVDVSLFFDELFRKKEK